MKRTSALCALSVLSLLATLDMAEARMRECRKNPANCTAAELCSNEMLGRNGEDSWAYPNHAAYAKEIGLPCAIKSTIPHVPSSPLRSGFDLLSGENRKKIQGNLAWLHYYSSPIDGIFGKETSLALIHYNRDRLGEIDLRSKANVNILLTSVLSIETTNKSAPSDLPPEANNSAPNDQDPRGEAVERDAYSEPILYSSGTGFIVSTNGHIVSNAHVVSHCEKVRAHMSGRNVEALVVTQDAKNDLSILKIEGHADYVFSLSEASPFPLQEISVVGFPFGESISSSVKFTRGIVSAVAGLGNDFSQIQVDAAMQPGNSGGPILDDFGNVVGVAVSKLSLKATINDYGAIPENINFGIKSSVVRSFLEGNGIKPIDERTNVISTRDLAESTAKGVVRLTCWLSPNKIELLTSDQ